MYVCVFSVVFCVFSSLVIISLLYYYAYLLVYLLVCVLVFVPICAIGWPVTYEFDLPWFYAINYGDLLTISFMNIHAKLHPL